MDASTSLVPMDGLCTAKSSRTGKPCKKRAIKGHTVCGTHGGSAPQVKEKASQNVVKAEAMRLAQRMVERDGTEKSPIDHLLDSLYLASQLVEVWGRMVAELDDVSDEGTFEGGFRGDPQKDFLLTTNNKGDTQLHPFVVEYRESLRDKAKIAKICIDAGVEVRRVELQEQQVSQAYEAFEATLAGMGLDREGLERARKLYAEQLRRL